MPIIDIMGNQYSFIDYYDAWDLRDSCRGKHRAFQCGKNYYTIFTAPRCDLYGKYAPFGSSDIFEIHPVNPRFLRSKMNLGADFGKARKLFSTSRKQYDEILEEIKNNIDHDNDPHGMNYAKSKNYDHIIRFNIYRKSVDLCKSTGSNAISDYRVFLAAGSVIFVGFYADYIYYTGKNVSNPAWDFFFDGLFLGKSIGRLLK